MSAVALADMDAVADEAALRFVAAAREAIAARGQFTVALTGGSAATETYPRLKHVVVDWTKVHVFFGDERAVPPDDPLSNYKGARDAFLDSVAIPAANVHRMRGEDPDLAAAARAYDAEIQAVCGPDRVLDVVHLGLGPDGHVCSLFPHHPLLESTDFVAWLDDSPKPPPRRITLTLPLLARARALWFIVGGRNKEHAVKQSLLEPASKLPAARAHRAAQSSLWLLDGDAARVIKQS